MSFPKQRVFVLWGKRFEELATVLFVCALRRRGIQVKIVGLHGCQTAGCHGLALVSDITLTEAMHSAHLACALICPCPARDLLQLTYDPRLLQFLQQTQRVSASIILSASCPLDVHKLTQKLPSSRELAFYPDTSDLLSYTEEFATELVGRQPKGSRIHA